MFWSTIYTISYTQIVCHKFYRHPWWMYILTVCTYVCVCELRRWWFSAEVSADFCCIWRDFCSVNTVLFENIPVTCTYYMTGLLGYRVTVLTPYRAQPVPQGLICLLNTVWWHISTYMLHYICDTCYLPSELVCACVCVCVSGEYII